MMNVEPPHLEGFHSLPLTEESGEVNSLPGSSRFCTDARYYLVDLGSSSSVELAIKTRGPSNCVQNVPEVSFTRLYDQKKADMFMLGTMLRTFLHNVRSHHESCSSVNTAALQRYTNVDFLKLFYPHMTRQHPDSRALAMLTSDHWWIVRSKTSVLRKSWPLKHRQIHWTTQVILDVLFSAQLVFHLTKRACNVIVKYRKW